LSAAQRVQYERDGHVVIDHVPSAAEVAELRAASDAIVAGARGLGRPGPAPALHHSIGQRLDPALHDAGGRAAGLKGERGGTNRKGGRDKRNAAGHAGWVTVAAVLRTFQPGAGQNCSQIRNNETKKSQFIAGFESNIV